MTAIPPAGRHGGDAAAVAAALGVPVTGLLDLSMSLNPLAPNPSATVHTHLDAIGRYPDPRRATAELAEIMGVDPERLLLTNGGAEAINLLAAELSGVVVEPEFALHPRGRSGPRWRSNPHNPTGLLAAADEVADVWDEAFYPLATGRWTRGDAGVPVVGSLTKLLACPGLRIGYLLANPALVTRCRDRQSGWSVNGLACAALPDLLGAVDLNGWAAGLRTLRAHLVDVLHRHGLHPRPSDANWVLVDASGLRERLAPHGVLVRDCTSFGLPDMVRIAVPDPDGIARLDQALQACREADPSTVNREPRGRFPRPRPVVGDRTSSAERAADPRAWALPDSTRSALAEVIAARRDIRRFRADDVEASTLDKVLRAGHAAPSVGHSQPWRFVIVRDPTTRAAAAAMADRERLRQAERMDRDSADHLRSLQLEGLREAPIGIVVCCDRRVAPTGVLGRATYIDTDLWSCACAIQNMWLTARAEGLGLGWVTLFDPEELANLLGLPSGVTTLGWLCLGWPDERPPDPGLERHGWSRRVALDSVVIHERWSEPTAGHPIDRSPSPQAESDHRLSRIHARDQEDVLLAAPGSLGLLGDALLKAETLTDVTSPGCLVIAAADHPVARLGVSAYPPQTTALIARALAEGAGQGSAAATNAEMPVRLLDCGIDGPLIDGWDDRRPTGMRGDLLSAAAMTVEDVHSLIGHGEAIGSELVSLGPLAVGEIGVGNTTVASAVASAALGLPVEAVVGRGAGSDTTTVRRKQQVIEQALERLAFSPPSGTWNRDQVLELLSAVGGPEQALLVGVCLAVAERGGLVLLDGMLTGTAALLATRVRPGTQQHLIAGHRSSEPGHTPVLAALGLEPVLDLRLRAGEGVGAVMALTLLRQGMQMRARTARTT